MILTESELLREAAESGFRPEILEKVVRLTELLETLRSHPFLKTRIALKGGTALNLFVLRLPTDSPLARGLGGLTIHWEVFGLRGPGAGCA